MKPIYKSLTLASMTLQVSLALNAQTYDGENTSDTALPAEVLDSLRVELIAPNVSGARDLIKSGECTIDGSDLAITLNTANWIKGTTYRVQVVATFGTQTQVIYALDVTVPYYDALSDEPQEYEDDVTVVSTIGDGTGSTITVDPTPTEDSTNPVASGGVYGALAGKADATVYAKDGDGNARITTPLSIGNGEATGAGAVASGYVNGDGAGIFASGDGSMVSGYAGGYASSISASSPGAVASGYAGEGARISAGADCAVASGYADMINGNVESSGQASQAFGIGVKATQDAQMVVGQCNVVDEDNSFQFIVGNGTDDANRSNAFAVTKRGELALFEADGTPVILDAATLKALIARMQ